MQSATVTYCAPPIDALDAPILHVRVTADEAEHGRIALCGALVGEDVETVTEVPVCKLCEHLLAT